MSEFEQTQIQFSAHIASLQSKVKALKKLLNEDQLKIYTESVLKDKEKFLENQKEATADTIEKINNIFS
jgi:hypothetical protein